MMENSKELDGKLLSIIDDVKVTMIELAKRGEPTTKVAVIGVGIIDDLHVVLASIASRHPDIDVVVIEESPEHKRIKRVMLLEDSTAILDAAMLRMPPERFKIEPMLLASAELSEASFRESNNKPWKVRKQNKSWKKSHRSKKGKR